MDRRAHIVTTPDVLAGKPAVRGVGRLTVVNARKVGRRPLLGVA